MAMLGAVYGQVLDMTLGAGAVILLVLAARLLLKGAPKAFSYALWMVVLFRLLCPPAFQAAISMGPQMESVTEDCTLIREEISPLGAAEAVYRAVGDAVNGGLGTQHIRTTGVDENGNVDYVTASWWDVWVLFGQYVWLAGAAFQFLRWGGKYLRLRRVLRTAVPEEDGVWLADHIGAPFVMGLLHPRIYLPTGLSQSEKRCILAHERCHIRRLDHGVKLLFCAARCIHWFNPLVWVAFRQFEKDMEMRCDEAVIRQLGRESRGDYAAALLRVAAGDCGGTGMSPAFGEGDVKERILNMANWKVPKKRTRVLAAVFCAVILAAGTVLLGCGREEPSLTGGVYKMETPVDTLIQPRISFDMEDQWFVFSYDPLSSYLSSGSFEIGDGVVTATTYDGQHTYTFEIVDSGTLRYVQTGDVPLMAMGLMNGDWQLAVPDGVLFSFSTDGTQGVYGGYVHSDASCTDPGCTDITHYQDMFRIYHDHLCAVFGCTAEDHDWPDTRTRLPEDALRGGDCTDPEHHGESGHHHE